MSSAGGGTIDINATMQEAVSVAAEAASSSIEAMGEAMASVAEQMTASLDAITGSAEQLQRMIDALTASIAPGFEEDSAAAATLQAQIDALAASMTAEGGAASAAASALQANTAALDENTAAADTNATAQDAANATREAGNASAAAGAAGLLMLALGAVKLGTDIISVGSQYESSMSVVQALTGQTAGQMAVFNAQILAMAPTMGVAPDQLAQGLYYVLSAGVSAKDAMGVLKVVTEASAAGMVDAATDADALTSALNSYGAGARLNTIRTCCWWRCGMARRRWRNLPPPLAKRRSPAMPLGTPSIRSLRRCPP